MHRHDWLNFVERAWGTFSKRNCPGDEIHLLGRVKLCSLSDCKNPMMFIPHDPRFNAVECELTL